MNLKLYTFEKGILQIAIALSFSILMVIIGLHLHNHQLSVFDEKNYVQYDAAHYLSIAESGYECFRCFEKFGGTWNEYDWCGNTGWFPGYPLTIRIVNVLVKDFKSSAVLINHIFLIGIALLSLRLLEFNNSNNPTLLLLIAFVCPGFIYYYAIFPMAGTLFFILLTLYSYINKYMICLFFSIFMATIYYPTGSFLMFPIIISSYIFAESNTRLFISESVVSIIAVLSSLLIAFGFMYSSTDYFDAYFKVSAKYNNHLHLPFSDIWNQIFGIFKNDNISITKNLQSSICILGTIIISLVNFKKFKAHTLNKLEFLSTFYLLVFLFLPWSTAGDFSSYRSESLLFPFIFSAKFDIKILYLLLIVLSVLGIYLSYDFFTGKIV